MVLKLQIRSKNISAIVLLLLFTHNALFSHITLWVWKAYMNEQIEELAKSIPNESLEEIILPYTQEPENEIAYNGEMYDVIRYEFRENSICYFCVKDFTENVLSSLENEDLSAKSISAKNQWADNAKQLQKNSTTKYTVNSNTTIIIYPTSDMHTYANPLVSIPATCSAIHTPPPNQKLI